MASDGMPPTPDHVHSHSSNSGRARFVQPAIAALVALLHAVALFAISTIDSRHSARTERPAMVARMIWIEPPPPAAPPSAATPGLDARHAAKALPGPTGPIQAASAASQRPGKRMAPGARPSIPGKVRHDDAIEAPPPEVAGAPAGSTGTQEQRPAPLNLNLPKPHQDPMAGGRQIYQGTSARKSESQVFSEAVERAVRPDCRSAYAASGLLAIPHLLKDAVSNSGCKW